MAFVVEDGTGLATANSYLSVADADSYHDDRGNAVWAAYPTSDKQAALVRATDYIDTRYGPIFKGTQEFAETPQALEFPRSNIYDRYGRLVEGIPTKLEKAVAELALKTIDGTELFLTPTVDESGQVVRERKEKIGPLEFTDKLSGVVETTRYFPEADRLLEEYVSSVGRIVRG